MYDPNQEPEDPLRHGKWVRLRMGKGMCIKVFVYCDADYTIEGLEATALEQLVSHLVKEGHVAPCTG